MGSVKPKLIIAVALVGLFLSYSFYLYASLPVKGYTISKEIAEGKMTWQKYNCNSCHQLYGLGGYLGPDLTNVYSYRDTNYIKAFLKNGTSTMPDFHLSNPEINGLLAFFKNINGSGSSDPRKFTINHDGTIEQ